MAKQGEKLAKKGSEVDEKHASDEQAAVTAYGSGNAAQVYFDLFPRKIKLSELEAAYPGMVDALVQHEGLGMVIGYEDDMTAVVLGKGGKRNLHTGEVEAWIRSLPMRLRKDMGQRRIDKRVWQLRRVMDFPSAGDLWLFSTVYRRRHRGRPGGVGGQPWRRGRRADRRLYLPSRRHGCARHPLLD